MSIQSKLSKAQARLKRSLRDYSVSVSGTEIEVIRLKVEENKYHDQEISVLSFGKIVVSLDLPDEIPIDRFRTDVTQPASVSQSTYFYDILPISGMARFEDNIEKNDLLLYKINDEREGQPDVKPLILVLKISELLGSISHGRLTGRGFYCSPHNIALPIEVNSIIESYAGIS